MKSRRMSLLVSTEPRYQERRKALSSTGHHTELTRLAGQVAQVLQEVPQDRVVCNLEEVAVTSEEAISTAEQAPIRGVLVKEHLSHRIKETSKSILATLTQMSIINS